MFKIEYEIKLNEAGRPYIDLAPDYENNPEDRFFVMEMTRYILQDTMSRKSPELDVETVEKMDVTERILGQISDEMAAIIWEMMRTNANTMMMLDVPYHIAVDTIDERDALPDENILFKDKIYNRVEGLRVLVRENKNCVYELTNGITNENWIEL